MGIIENRQSKGRKSSGEKKQTSQGSNAQTWGDVVFMSVTPTDDDKVAAKELSADASGLLAWASAVVTEGLVIKLGYDAKHNCSMCSVTNRVPEGDSVGYCYTTRHRSAHVALALAYVILDVHLRGSLEGWKFYGKTEEFDW